MTSKYITVWDPCVRMGHWTVVAAFTIAYFTGEDFLSTHVWAGYIVGGVVLARIIWGFVGPRHARFSDFAYGPRAVLSYLFDMVRFRAWRYISHSPAGGAMVIALLVSLSATVITGLAVYGAEEQAGPLAPLYAAETGSSSTSVLRVSERSDEGGSKNDASSMEELHEMFANLTLVLVALHICGVAFASIAHRENLISAMINGRKRGPDMAAPP